MIYDRVLPVDRETQKLDPISGLDDNSRECERIAGEFAS